VKTIAFSYKKKSNNEVSERLLMVLKEPEKDFSGIDLSELEVNDALQFVHKYELLQEEFLKAAKQLQAEYDLTHNYRKFLSENMSNVTEV
jgi:hypothetical protein